MLFNNHPVNVDYLGESSGSFLNMLHSALRVELDVTSVITNAGSIDNFTAEAPIDIVVIPFMSILYYNRGIMISFPSTLEPTINGMINFTTEEY